ncbi:MAG: DUF6064 family protein [Bacteroidetes bacterium]|nr:DUF6064 family protein [Bacteroidota bacterium]
MKTPISTDPFFSVFEKYNHAIFPVQIILFLLSLLAFIAIGSKIKQKDKFVAGILGIIWIWTGIVYHWVFFSHINILALGYGVVFILQGLFLVWEGVILYNLKFVFRMTVQALLGYFFILYGLIFYPVVGYLIEPNLSGTMSIGLPGPTIILTFGFLLLCDKKFSKYLLIIPSLWAVIGISAIIKLGFYQDTMMLIAAIIADVMILRSKRPPDEKSELQLEKT